MLKSVPQHPEDRLIWFRGGIVPAGEAKLAALSPTAQFGLNVFEGIRGYWSDARHDLFLFRLGDHLTRLFNSCRLIGIESPYARDEIRTRIIETLRANDYREDVAVRTTLFVDGEGTWSSSAPVDMFIAPIAKSRRSLAERSGLSACVSSWERISDRSMPPRVKSGANYVNGRHAHLEARRNGYDVPILLGNNGKVSEGAGACIFIVRDGVLITPPVHSSILESITRDTLLAIAGREGVPIEVRDIDRTELLLADEAFLCGSAVELTPIVGIDGLRIGSGEMGPLTTNLLAWYMEAVCGDAPESAGWQTPVWQD